MLSVETEVTHINQKINVRSNAKSSSIKNDIFIEGTDFRGGSQKKTGHKIIFWSWLSVSIDLMIMISLSCFSLILFSVMIKVQYLENFKVFMSEKSLLNIFSTTFLFLLWFYLVFTRYLIGATLGEWSCQIRLGQPSQRLQSDYFFRVFTRSTVILLTGVFLLPLLSLFFKRDLAGDLSGLKIFSLV